MCLQEFLNPFCEEVENAFPQPNPGIQEIAGNLRLNTKKRILQTALLGVRSARKLNPPSESESENHGSFMSCV